jgi:hypothetical protein
MTQAEMIDEGWDFQLDPITPVIVLDDGTLIYPSRDHEGNGPGALFGKASDGRTVTFLVSEESVESDT